MRFFALRPRQKEAVALFIPPAYPAAQLVELGKPEPFRIENYHRGCVGNVHADFDYRGGNETVVLLCLESGHYVRLFLFFHFAVQQREAGLRQFGAQIVVKLGYRHERAFVVTFDFRADEVRLVAELSLFGYV